MFAKLCTWLGVASVAGCGAAPVAPQVANREGGRAPRDGAPLPTFELRCTRCLKPQFTTLAWTNASTLEVTLHPPALGANESFYFAAFGRGNDTRVDGETLVLTVPVRDPRPAQLELDVQVGVCVGGLDRCPMPHLEPATAVITFPR